MRAFVIGSKELSCVILESMIECGYEVLGVYSRDREEGMKTWHQLGHRSLEHLAIEKGIRVYDGMQVNSKKSIDLLASLNLDVIVSCFWSELFQETILNIPKLGVFNVHTALLPANRGSRPGPWAIISGANQAGVTLHKMTLGVDDGPIVDQISFDIERDETAMSLYEKVNANATVLMRKALIKFKENTYVLTPQDESKASYQLRGEPFGGQVNFFWSEDKIDRFKRAMTFPPFRAYRLSPHHASKPELVVSFTHADAEREGSYQPFTFFNLNLFNERLSGGNRWQRKALKTLMVKGHQNVARITSVDDFSAYQPLLESLKIRGFLGVIGNSFSSFTETNLGHIQPHRETNGILNFPLFVPGVDWKKMIQKAHEITVKKNCPLYLTIDEKDLVDAITKAQIAQEIIKLGGRLASIDNVCKEFDTEYENISA